MRWPAAGEKLYETTFYQKLWWLTRFSRVNLPCILGHALFGGGALGLVYDPARCPGFLPWKNVHGITREPQWHDQATQKGDRKWASLFDFFGIAWHDVLESSGPIFRFLWAVCKILPAGFWNSSGCDFGRLREPLLLVICIVRTNF